MKAGYLASQAACLKKHESAGLAYGVPEYIDADNAALSETVHDATPEVVEWSTYLWISSHYGSLPASISSIMVPRRTFESVGVFDASYDVAGDLDPTAELDAVGGDRDVCLGAEGDDRRRRQVDADALHPEQLLRRVEEGVETARAD